MSIFNQKILSRVLLVILILLFCGPSWTGLSVFATHSNEYEHEENEPDQEEGEESESKRVDTNTKSKDNRNLDSSALSEKQKETTRVKPNAKSDFPLLSYPVWKEECGSCHTLYHPGLLPERSWKLIMEGLPDHFGEDASLDSVTQQQILVFLTQHAAENSTARKSQKILKSLSSSDIPLRFTKTPYYIHKHEDIKPNVYKRKSIGSPANCSACHKDADLGIFNERSVKIPKL